MTLRIGSICTGYGGLDHAVQDVFGGELAWVADIDPGANQILAHHYPHLPNLGDITTVDWSQVEPVDIFTGGFPCQPVSAAGQRKGVTDERWLFDDICAAISRMVARPRLLVFENVAGLLSANGGDAMARVVQGLAALGYVGRYRLVRASDVGAPHRRERVFILARLATADPSHLGHERRREARLGRPGPSDGYLAAPDAQGDGRYEGRTEPARLIGGPDAALGSAEAAADAHGTGWEGTQPESPWSGSERGGAPAPADAASLGHGDAGPAGERGLPAPTVAGDLPGDVDWGQYGPAIRRWERILGRRAPAPLSPDATASA